MNCTQCGLDHGSHTHAQWEGRHDTPPRRRDMDAAWQREVESLSEYKAMKEPYAGLVRSAFERGYLARCFAPSETAPNNAAPQDTARDAKSREEADAGRNRSGIPAGAAPLSAIDDTKPCYAKPCAWIRPWDGDVSDEGLFVIDYGSEPPHDNHQWAPLYAEDKDLYDSVV